MPRGLGRPKRKCDGVRGVSSTKGWWISLEESKERACGKETWWIDSSRNTFFGCDEAKWKLCCPIDVVSGMLLDHKRGGKHVWLCSNKDMCLGEWRLGSKGEFVEHGVGVKCNFNDLFKGKIQLGEWSEGRLNGFGKSYWLATSPSWQRNSHAKSQIKAVDDFDKKKNRGIPFVYVGNFVDGMMCDDYGAAIIKCGKLRKGCWLNDEPLKKEGGKAEDWGRDHDSRHEK